MGAQRIVWAGSEYRVYSVDPPVVCVMVARRCGSEISQYERRLPATSQITQNIIQHLKNEAA